MANLLTNAFDITKRDMTYEIVRLLHEKNLAEKNYIKEGEFEPGNLNIQNIFKPGYRKLTLENLQYHEPDYAKDQIGSQMLAWAKESMPFRTDEEYCIYWLRFQICNFTQQTCLITNFGYVISCSCKYEKFLSPAMLPNIHIISGRFRLSHIAIDRVIETLDLLHCMQRPFDPNYKQLTQCINFSELATSSLGISCQRLFEQIQNIAKHSDDLIRTLQK